MKKYLFSLIILAISVCLYAQDIQWIDGTTLGVLGRPATIKEGYDRFAPDVYPKLQKENLMSVYWLSKHSAGLHLDFSTNSSFVYVKYELTSLDFMVHMPLTGSNGVDTYIKYKGKWNHFDTIYPSKTNTLNEKKVFDKNTTLLKNIEFLDFSVNLPLYNGVKSFQIGIEKDAKIIPIKYEKDPVLIYGTSITQGGCASRPGTSYSNTLRRAINRDVYNLGFSGSGLLENLIADTICSYSPALLIMDCVTNMAGLSKADFDSRFKYFYTNFRKSHPNTPIIFIEQPTFSNYWAIYEGDCPANKQIQELFKEWKKNDKNIYLIKSKDLYGNDNEASVDTIHATDLGFYRMSQIIIKEVNKHLK